jgi:predicted esterase
MPPPSLARLPFAFALALAVLVVGSARAQKDDKVPDVAPSTKAERGKVLAWKSAQGRPYWYRLPETIDSKDPPNLLLMLHGTGLDHRWSFWNYPITGAFRRKDIVVSPDGLTPQGQTFNFVQGPKDGEQIAGLIADFKKAFPIGRVYLYGHSRGAFFTYWFAGEHPELIDGIVAHAGNVLDVKHDKLTKQKVAIAILHGRADAVVPVDCAIRTEKIYREQGYEKLKLEIVEYLNEQSGHWPLPDEVAKLLDWVDQVTTLSAAQAVLTAASALAGAAPDLAVVTEQVGRARKLLAKASEDEKKALPPQIDALAAFVEKAAAAHAAKLLQEPALVDPKAAYGAWAAHFVLADRAFGELPGWKKAMARPRELAGKHEKLVDKALKALDKGGKGCGAAGAEAFAAAFLSARADALRMALRTAFAGAAKGEAEARQAFDDVVRQRTEVAEAAAKTAAAVTAPLLEELRAARPELFESQGK